MFLTNSALRSTIHALSMKLIIVAVKGFSVLDVQLSFISQTNQTLTC